MVVLSAAADWLTVNNMGKHLAGFVPVNRFLFCVSTAVRLCADGLITLDCVHTVCSHVSEPIIQADFSFPNFASH